MLVFAFLLMVSDPVEEPPQIADVDLMALSDEMKAFLHEHVQSKHNTRQRLVSLVWAIFDEDKLNLTYGNHRTKTAQETFASRTGNCLSFTNMFVAMARYLEIPAHFQEIVDMSRWDRRGDVVMNNKHMNVRVLINGRHYEIDFFPFEEKKRHMVRRISDEVALGHFYNNKGAEAYAKKEYQLARAYFEKALETAPKMSQAWSNLGVALRKLGHLQRAEDCYLKAIKYNRFEYTAMSNLVQLYHAMGQSEKAERYMRKVERHRNKNPYHHFVLGENAYESGDIKASVSHFKRAIRLHQKDPEFYLALARSYYKLGDTHRTEKFLRLARKWSSIDEKDRYNDKLEALLANSGAKRSR